MPESPSLSGKPQEKANFTIKDLFMGLGCGVACLLIVLYVVFGVIHFFSAPRPERLLEPIRKTQDAGEKSVRRELERYAKSAFWQGGRGKELPPPDLVGPEPRPGISVVHFSNGIGRNLHLLFDGAEIFKLEVPKGGAVSLELKSGAYDYLVVAPGGQGGGMPVAPYFRRVELKGSYLDALTSGAPSPEINDKTPKVRRVN